MTKKLNPMLKPDNRVKLLLSGMENIDTLQHKTIRQARQNIKDVEMFQKGVQQQFEKSITEYKKILQPLQEQVKKQTQEHKKLFVIDEAMKKMIDDAVEVSQEIEGYTTVVSQHLQEEVSRIMKRYNVKVSTQKK